MKPKTIAKIHKFITKHNKRGTFPSLACTKRAFRAFIPDVSKYRGRLLCKLELKIYWGGNTQYWALLTEEEFKMLSENGSVEIRFGEINGKHSDIRDTWGELFREKITDPYEIKSFVEKLSRPEENITNKLRATVRKLIRQKKK